MVENFQAAGRDNGMMDGDPGRIRIRNRASPRAPAQQQRWFVAPVLQAVRGQPQKSIWPDLDELERAEECSGPLTLQDRPQLNEILINLITLLPEVSDEEMAEMQAEDVDLGPIIEWLQDTEPRHQTC